MPPDRVQASSSRVLRRSAYQHKNGTLLWLLVLSQSFPSPRHLTAARRAVWSTIPYWLFGIDLQAGRSAIRHLPTRPMADASCSESGGQPTQTDPHAQAPSPRTYLHKPGRHGGGGPSCDLYRRHHPPPYGRSRGCKLVVFITGIVS